jgi:hypothetical protein
MGKRDDTKIQATDPNPKFQVLSIDGFDPKIRSIRNERSIKSQRVVAYYARRRE